jgi:hypothetical protein
VAGKPGTERAKSGDEWHRTLPAMSEVEQLEHELTPPFESIKRDARLPNQSCGRLPETGGVNLD